MIRGKKNFMPGCPLVLGFGILFRLDEVSAMNQKQRMMLVGFSRHSTMCRRFNAGNGEIRKLLILFLTFETLSPS